ncbi:single-stranded DNA-binding protein [Thalassotalea fusca]
MTLSTQNHLCNLTLLGNLVAKPDIRYQANPVVAIAEMIIATHTKWYDKANQQYREWTNYHTVKMVGDVVERSLLHANKGDIVLIQGHLVDSKKNNRQIIHATYAHPYPKGYAKSINQIYASGRLSSDIQLRTTENNRTFAEITLEMNFFVHSPITGEMRNVTLTRLVHVWEAQAIYLSENAQLGDQLIVDGKLNYMKNDKQQQMIDAHHVVLLRA